MIYPLKEDSCFLAEILKKYFKNKSLKNKTFLDMGSGSGIQAETIFSIIKDKGNILCADINSEAINYLKKKGFNVIKSDLFKNIKRKFDYIIFNPPYLPEDKYDKKKDTTGGKRGDETILAFLIDAKKHLQKKGKIFLLLSSLTPQNRINKILKNYKHRILARKKLFFEELKILLLEQN